jgi:hypothetical protein
MSSPTTEIEALAAIDAALSNLDDQEARERVIRWAIAKFAKTGQGSMDVEGDSTSASRVGVHAEGPASNSLNPSAALWLRRNAISSDQSLSMIFSLDQQELDVIAAEVQGDTVKKRMRSVFLLRGVCGLLRSGEFKFSDDEARMTCKHYNAYDKNNFANYVKSISDEVVGSRTSGYALTPKGQKAAADLIKAIGSSLVW